MISASLLCPSLILLSGLRQEPVPADMEIFKTMNRGQWGLARELLQKRSEEQASIPWIVMIDGDLCFWEGNPELAVQHYRRAFAEAGDQALKDSCRGRIELANSEIRYRERIAARSRFSLWMGAGTVTALLASPFLALLFFQYRRKK